MKSYLLSWVSEVCWKQKNFALLPQKGEEEWEILDKMNNINQLYNAFHFEVMPKYTGHAVVFWYDFINTQIIYFWLIILQKFFCLFFQ